VDLFGGQQNVTIAEKAKAIINLVRANETRAVHDAKIARANYAGICAMSDHWENDYDNKYGIDPNPYNTEPQRVILVQAEIKEKEAKEYLEFVTDHFIDMLKEG